MNSGCRPGREIPYLARFHPSRRFRESRGGASGPNARKNVPGDGSRKQPQSNPPRARQIHRHVPPNFARWSDPAREMAWCPPENPVSVRNRQDPRVNRDRRRNAAPRWGGCHRVIATTVSQPPRTSEIEVSVSLLTRLLSMSSRTAATRSCSARSTAHSGVSAFSRPATRRSLSAR